MSAAPVPYAGIATRGVALGIDALLAHGTALVIAAALGLVASLFGGVSLDLLEKLLAAVAWTLIVGFYFVLFWSTAGQTPGMRLMGLRVVTRAGEHPGVVRSIVRVIGLALAIIPLFAGFLPVLIDNRRRALQDLMAGTFVLYAGTEPPPEPAPAMGAVVRDVRPMP
jgi:uncharacterized RDD family membrane protein YckC